MNHRAQATMEFLMTYGWSILAVLIAIGALAYFGILSPDRFFPSKCVIGNGFSCEEYTISETDGIQMNIQNNMGVDTSDATVTVRCVSGCEGEASMPYSSGLQNGGITGLVTFPVTVPSSGRVKAEVNVVYTKDGESLSHNMTGEITGNPE